VIGADIEPSDVIAHDDEDIRPAGGRRLRGRGLYRTQEEKRQYGGERSERSPQSYDRIHIFSLIDVFLVGPKWLTTKLKMTCRTGAAYLSQTRA
jgi:hypothetical protein